MKLFQFLFGATLLSLVCLHAHAQHKEYVFATYTYSTNNRLENLKPLTEYLSRKTGVRIKAISYPGVQALISAIRNDSVDFAMMNTSGYLLLKKNHQNIVAPFMNLEMGNDSITNYGGCLIARTETGLRSVKDIQGNDKKYTLSLVSNSSTSGNLVPRLLLYQHQITNPDSTFHVQYAGTHKKVVEEVLTGKSELGGCGCSEIDSVRKYMNFDETAVIIGAFNDIPLGPVVYHLKIDQALISRFTQLLSTLHIEKPEIFAGFCNGWTEFKQAGNFKEITDKEYDNFRKMFGNDSTLWKLLE